MDGEERLEQSSGDVLGKSQHVLDEYPDRAFVRLCGGGDEIHNPA